jgi:hypothetical protein
VDAALEAIDAALRRVPGHAGPDSPPEVVDAAPEAVDAAPHGVPGHA